MALDVGSLLLCLTSCLLAGAAAAEDKKPQVIDGWGTVTDPAGDCSVKQEDGKLVVKVPGGTHDLNALAGGMTAPRVLKQVEGNFVAQVKVTGDFRPGKKAVSPNARPFNGAGLLIWHDEKNYLRLERNIFWVDELSEYFCYPPLLEYFEDGRYQGTDPEPRPYDEFFEGLSTWLRLERWGDKVVASYSQDGKKWTAVKQITTQLPEKVRVGVAAVNNSARPFTVEFDRLQVDAKPNKIGIAWHRAGRR